MPFIGNQLSTSFQNVETQTITGDGSTSYTLNNAVADGKDLLVYINNVKQEEGSGKSYTATGTTITFTEAVASTDSCYVVFIGQAIGTVTPKDGSIVSSMLADANLEMPNTLDLNGKEFFLDADADTSITADTDDTIDIKIAGSDVYQITATKVDLNGKELVLDADADTSITADTDDQIDIRIGGTDKIHITSTGLGIGTTSPSADLGVNGRVTLGDQAGSGTAGAGSMIVGANSFFIQASEHKDSSTRVPIVFSNIGGSTESMRIDASGRVGIGTNSPSVLLDLESTAPVIRFTDSDATGTPECEISGAGGDITIRADRDNEKSSSIIGFEVDGSEKMRIDSNGQVGINVTPVTTTGSAAQLHVDGDGRYNNGTQAAIFQSTNNRGTVRVRTVSDEAAELFWDSNGAARWLMSCRSSGASHKMSWYNAHSSPSYTAVGSAKMVLTQAGNLSVTGSLSKGSGSFKIDHPLPSKSDTHHLVHSFLEGPQADLIYRGKVDLVDGSATVNIDTASGMSDGTFVLLCDNVQCFTSNEDGWTAIKGSVSGNTLTITAQDDTSTDKISWMVIGERKDKHMIDTDWTDKNGKVITEPLKPKDEEDSE